MAQTFRTLAIFLTIAILATMTLGFWSYYTPSRDNDESVAHFVLGLTTVLGALLVHCLIFIYFLGTGRWVKEVTLAYQLPDQPWHKETRELKRATFPPALFSMLFAIAAAAAGSGLKLQAWPFFVHLLLGISTLLVNLWAFRIELNAVARNGEIILEVMQEVERIRAANGLNSNDEALQEEDMPIVNIKELR